MKRSIFICLALGTPLAFSQNPPAGEKFDPVQEAIREFNKHRSEGRDVTVVLPPPTQEKATKPEKEKDKEKSSDSKAAKSPSPEKTAPDSTPPPAPSNPPAAAASPHSNASQRKPGLGVEVKKIQTGSGPIDPSQVKLLAPFAAKPLLQPPAGWRIESNAEAPPFTREVELAPGAKITLTIRPHLLTPIADGASIFAIPEPGYESAAGYRQTKTVGAILSNSIQQMDRDTQQLGHAIDQLQQLLSSLPSTTPAP
ncbi:hypothetical protein JIN85_09200 [Luteolibacter pohnpeiensis]|uniref:Uncharacterized protein n=1 Tax=Luteolibacter pohnpeiensis TaxID=454153 RepID=A0A934VQY3_9BACT|nr:hypothetical protein [Luteolibacter pohnpeiensis]MBK1882591.1 hypothetical protein [Luteolibacter pohnpeiensis]